SKNTAKLPNVFPQNDDIGVFAHLDAQSVIHRLEQIESGHVVSSVLGSAAEALALYQATHEELGRPITRTHQRSRSYIQEAHLLGDGSIVVKLLRRHEALHPQVVRRRL